VFFPEFLYQLSGRDQQVTWLDPSFSAVGNSALNVFVTVDALTVPSDRVLVLQSVVGMAEPGAGQNVTDIRLQLFAPGAQFAAVISRDPVDKAANIPAILNWSGSLIVPPLWRVLLAGSFNAGAVANAVTIWTAGILIPPANIQRV
jgi:hypothetical protein